MQRFLLENHLPKNQKSHACWYMLVIPALGRQRQGESRVRNKPGLTNRDSISKKPKRKEIRRNI
jgi:hypothetical protein